MLVTSGHRKFASGDKNLSLWIIRDVVRTLGTACYGYVQEERSCCSPFDIAMKERSAGRKCRARK